MEDGSEQPLSEIKSVLGSSSVLRETCSILNYAGHGSALNLHNPENLTTVNLSKWDLTPRGLSVTDVSAFLLVTRSGGTIASKHTPVKSNTIIFAKNKFAWGNLNKITPFIFTGTPFSFGRLLTRYSNLHSHPEHNYKRFCWWCTIASIALLEHTKLHDYIQTKSIK